MNKWSLTFSHIIPFGELLIDFDKKKNAKVLQVGFKSNTLTPFRVRKLIHRAIHFLQNQKAELEQIDFSELKGFNSEFIQIALHEANYLFNRFKTGPTEQCLNLSKVVPLEHSAHEILRSINLAKDLINAPPNLATPAYLVETVAKSSSGAFKLTNKSFRQGCLQGIGLNAFLAVAGESAHEPYLIEINYQPPQETDEIIGLIGKGITFDTGGLSLKPSNYMYGMHSDMAGGASVIAILQACATLKINAQVKGLILACENGFGGKAYRPGDIIKAFNGQTIEIIDTDAEGRLTLADALAYLSRDPKVTQIIDYATLTGSCSYALGEVAAGAFTNSPELLKRFKRVAEEVGEPIWELPIFDEYTEELQADEIADLFQCTGKPDACLAAAFLQEFLDKTNQPAWLHLDIAGTAFTEKDQEFFKLGATGRHIWSTINFLLKNKK